ncbi:MAG: dependent oxidoreductase [Herbinix sp.]|jgi:phytoene dehydrogenase-like protein|nr:dependent oxidoreductase [Herbinix sp.]
MKRIIIIGGGIAGLSAGIYAQQHGFESVIYEKHSLVGGQCTGWDRKGYHVDGCIHWLTGTKPGTGIYEIWKNTGALDGIDIIQLDNFGTFELGGYTIILWKDLDRLEKDFIKLSPEDTPAIKELIQDIRTAQTMDMPTELPTDMMPVKDLIKFMMSIRKAGSVMSRTGKISCSEYAKRFQHPALQKLFINCMPEGYSIAAFLFSMATFSSGNGAIPKGGSREMALRMEKRYKDLGGKVITRVSAEEIIIENDCATAVSFSDGTTVKADYIIAACDTKVSFDKLLKGKFNDKKFEMRYNNPTDYTLPSCVQLAYGIAADLKDYPTSLYLESEPYRVGATEFKSVGIKNYSYEPSFAPEGHAVILSLIDQTDPDYFYWEKLSPDKEAYRKEKQRIADLIQQKIEKRFPELIGKITQLDVTTPMTYRRYTNAYHGAWMSFMMTPKSKYMMHSGKIRGLKNCFLTGQWLEPPGGLPTAVVTGKFTILRICKKEKML